ncbi:MAG: hypothetical protein WDW36_007987 [Sanguina aurantia]
MAAATAAGEPVDVVQLMAWLEPLAYRPFEPCPEHMASMAQLPIPRWVMSAVVATESPSTASADFPGRLELLSVAVMWDAPSPALQAVLQGKGPAGRRLALEMQQADKASKTLLSQVAGHRSLSPQQARQAVNNQEISFTRKMFSDVEGEVKFEKMLAQVENPTVVKKVVGFGAPVKARAMKKGKEKRGDRKVTLQRQLPLMHDLARGKMLEAEARAALEEPDMSSVRLYSEDVDGKEHEAKLLALQQLEQENSRMMERYKTVSKPATGYGVVIRELDVGMESG